MTIPVGIDIGNSKCVLAISHNGVVDALLNEESAREIPTLVHFATKHRLFGTAAANYSTSKPSSTISQLKRLFDPNNPRDELLRLPYETSTDADGFASVEVRYLGEHHVFTAVEMLAMLLAHLRRSAERAVGSAISDCVIGVPSYFTEQQKRAYLHAALIAGWNPLGLLPDGFATAQNYRANREGTQDTVVVVFVDIGHCDTQVTVVRFRGRQVEMIAEACDGHLGGWDFDEVVFRYFVDSFGKQLGIDVRSNAKATARLRTACEKGKRVLSANKEAQVGVDSLMNGVDANGVITRETFERLSSGLLNRIQELFREALMSAKVGVDVVHSVELVGSGSRIPAISKVLTEVFGREMSRTLNGSECIACGCALHCEKILRPVFRDNEHEKMHGRVTSRLEACSGDLIAIGAGTKNLLLKAREKEQKLQQQDKMIECAKEERNNLEAYIYKSRNKTKGITKESERDKISAKLTQMEEWLYEEGDDEPENVYKDKLLELKLLLSPIGHHGVETQVQARIGFQTDISEPPVLRSLISCTGDVSPECSDAQLSDQISPRQNKTSSQSEIEVNVSGWSGLPLTREEGPTGISTRGAASVVTKKRRKWSRIWSWCQLCSGTDVKSPPRR